MGNKKTLYVLLTLLGYSVALWMCISWYDCKLILVIMATIFASRMESKV